MATSEARQALEKYERQQAQSDGGAAPSYERTLFKKGGSIGVTLTSTGRDVHGLCVGMDADIHVFPEAIVVVPGGESDE